MESAYTLEATGVFRTDGVASDATVWKVPMVLLHGGQTQTLLLQQAQQTHVLPGCPAVDAGTALPAVPDDLTGAPRPWGPAYDIGAYEHREASSWVYLPVVYKQAS